MENRFRLQSDEEGKRLDVFLAEKLSITRSKVKEIFEEGFVRIEGRIPKPSLKVRKGLVIEGKIPAEKPMLLIPQQISLDILYEDEYILAVNKPKGMVVHPSFGHSEGTLVNAVLAYLQKPGNGQSRLGGTSWAIPFGRDKLGNAKNGESILHIAYRREHGAETMEHEVMGDGTATPHVPSTQNSTRLSRNKFGGQELKTQNWVSSGRPGIVHRLDKGTTGVILIAKDLKTQERLSELFKERAVHKTYRAIVEGIVRKNEGVIEESIGRHPLQRKKMAVVKRGGRESETAYKILQRLDSFTYIEAYPRTGRTHQIRVHLAHIGHPVAGDDVYGKKAKHIADRPLLHAYAISFPHPSKNLQIAIEAPVPEDMVSFVAEHEGVKSEDVKGEIGGKGIKK
jgi:23S rRNA-/tRNA-specific pseudouridylate synthase